MAQTRPDQTRQETQNGLQKLFDELAEHATREIHSALLIGGGRAMKGTIHMWLGAAIQWHLEQNKPTPKPKKRHK